MRQAAKRLFDLDVKILITEHTQEKRGNLTTEHVVFSVETLDKTTTLSQNNKSNEIKMIPSVKILLCLKN